MILNNNCNVGYAFINFVHSAYILDFYYEYNNKRWTMYNSDKICEIAYGRIQGKRKLIKHFEKSKVWKNPNQNIKPLVINTKKINEEEIQEILDKYYRRRFKEKAEISEKKDTEGTKVTQEPEFISGQMKLSDSPERSQPQIPEERDQEQTEGQIPKILQVSEKRYSQNPSEIKKKLDEKEQVKRPASDDDKGASSDEEKKGKHDQSTVFKKLKLNLKNISMTSRGNFNSSNNKSHLT